MHSALLFLQEFTRLETFQLSSVAGKGLSNKFFMSESSLSLLSFHIASFSGGTMTGIRLCMDDTGEEDCFVNIEQEFTLLFSSVDDVSHIPAKAKGFPC